MKRITSIITKSLVAILISGGLLAVSAQAQIESGITVTIPFAFSAGGQNNPAGAYHIMLLSDPFLLSIRNVNTGKERVIIVRPEEGRSFASHEGLIFRRYEGHSDLAEVHFSGASTYSEVVSGPVQKHGPRIAETKVGLSGDSAIVRPNYGIK